MTAPPTRSAAGLRRALAAKVARTWRDPSAMIHALSLSVMVAATLWFAFTAIWGMAGIPYGGHIGGCGTAWALQGENMVRWRIAYPTYDWYTDVPPPKSDYICHHPFGVSFLPLPLSWLFGHRDFMTHLPATLLYATNPPLLYGIAKERWGPPMGAVAAAAYAFIPIAVGFSGMWNLEMVVIFGSLLMFWGHSRHMTTSKTRYLVASVAGAAIAGLGDWAGYIIVSVVLGWGLFRAFVLPGRLAPRIRFLPYVRWWGLSVAAVVLTLLLWVGLYYRADALGQWMGAGMTRSSGSSDPLSSVLAARKDWIDFSFTTLVIGLGKIAAPVCVLRLLVFRRDEEVYSIALLVGATAQYVAFKQGADVHIFWPQYFAPYYALALPQAIHTLGVLPAWMLRRWFGGRGLVAVTGVVFGLGMIPPLLVIPDGVRSLWVWRRTGGRYDDHGSLIRSDLDELEVIRQVVVPQKRRGMHIDTHGSAVWYWHHTWAFDGFADGAGDPLSGSTKVAMHPFWIARGSGMSAEDEKRIVSEAHVRIYGDVWLVDQRERVAPVDAFAVVEREPNPLQWLLWDNTEPVRTIGATPDPWLTWEARASFGQEAPVPTGQPHTIDEMRIAHNIAVARHDDGAAAQWQATIEAQLDRTRATAFDHGVDLLGVRAIGGVEPRVQAWFRVKEPLGAMTFSVRSTIDAKAPFSFVPVPATEREMAYPPPVPTKLWRVGGIYRTETILMHRIGRERYAGHWATLDGSSTPHRTDGAPDTTLLVVN